jgi:hypothetical protein
VKTFEYIKLTNTIVAQTLDAGGSLEDCIVVLDAKIGLLEARLLTVLAIAPKKYRLPDGRVVVWHCPDELVPEEVLK